MREKKRIENTWPVDIECELMFIAQNLRLMFNVTQGDTDQEPYALNDMVNALCERSLKDMREIVYRLREGSDLLASNDPQVKAEFDRMERDWKEENEEAEEPTVALN
jgi:hypothetical protein